MCAKNKRYEDMSYEMVDGIYTPRKKLGRKNPMRVWIWKCSFPGCGATGKKPMTHSKAQRGGRNHAREFHGSSRIDPILIKLSNIRLSNLYIKRNI